MRFRLPQGIGRSSALVVGLAISGASASAQIADQLYTQGFWPNRLIVTTTDRIVEFELDGTKIRELTSTSGGFQPVAARFGPNGHLYVVDEGNDQIVEINPDGVQVGALGGGGLLDDPQDIAFGPDGNLWVTSFGDDEVVVLTRGGVQVDELGAGSTLDGPTGLSFAPNGHLFVVSSNTDTILEFAGSEVVRELGIGSGLDNPMGVMRRGDGTLLVASSDTDSVFQFNALGGVESPIGASAGLDAPTFLAVGPDGNTYVASQGNDKVVVFDASGGIVREITDASLDGVTGLVISPFRFKSTVRGPLANEDFLLKTQTEGIVLTYAPGSGIAMVTAIDSPNKLVDLVSIYNSDALVFHGLEEFSIKETQRAFHGLQVPGTDVAMVRGTGSIAFTITGKINKATGIFGVTKLNGSLHRSNANGVYVATASSSKSLLGPKSAQ